MMRKYRDDNRATRRKRERLAERLEQARAAACSNVRKFFSGMTYNMSVDPVPPEQQVYQHVIDYRSQPDPTRPYCIVQYEGKSRIECYAEALQSAYKWNEEQAMAYARSVYTRDIYQNCAAVFARPKAERQFQNYGKAIAHLTKVKLNIIQEDEEYRGLTPCKIVEGCYTRNDKPYARKITEFPNVGISMGWDDTGGGQPCEQRQPSISDRKAVARANRTTSGGGWTTTISSPSTGVVTSWDAVPLSGFL